MPLDTWWRVFNGSLTITITHSQSALFLADYLNQCEPNIHLRCRGQSEIRFPERVKIVLTVGGETSESRKHFITRAPPLNEILPCEAFIAVSLKLHMELFGSQISRMCEWGYMLRPSPPLSHLGIEFGWMTQHLWVTAWCGRTNGWRAALGFQVGGRSHGAPGPMIVFALATTSLCDCRADGI